jgi:hypothetical protein
VKFTVPTNLNPYENQREVFLPAANVVFAAAYLKGLLKDAPAMDQETAWQLADKIAGMYAAAYDSPDRFYHTLQHPRIQMLNQQGDEMVQRSFDALTYKDSAGYAAELARTMPDEIAQTLRDQDRHDCLYYFAKSDTAQHRLLAPYKEKEPPVPLSEIVSSAFGGNEALESGSKPLGVTLGTLAAICTFPNGKGGFEAGRTFENPKLGEKPKLGLNEYASAVHAITQENKERKAQGFPPLSIRETLTTCITIAATIPFQDKSHLDAIAENVDIFLKTQDKLCSALGVEANNDAARGELVDSIVHTACDFANRDVRNLSDVDQFSMYYADKSIYYEMQGVPQDPVQEFTLAFRNYEQHSSAEELQARGLGTKDGFIYGNYRNGVIFHDFTAPLSHGKWAVKEADTLHAHYNATRAKVQFEHQCDMVLAALGIAAALRNETPRITKREDISDEMIKGFFEKRSPSDPSDAKALVDIIIGKANNMGALRSQSFQTARTLLNDIEQHILPAGEQHRHTP